MDTNFETIWSNNITTIKESLLNNIQNNNKIINIHVKNIEDSNSFERIWSDKKYIFEKQLNNVSKF